MCTTQSVHAVIISSLKKALFIKIALRPISVPFRVSIRWKTTQNPEFRDALKAAMSNIEKVIPELFKRAKIVKYDISEISKIISKTQENLSRAYSRYSNVQMSAAVVSSSTKKVYYGVNVENASYGLTICAERIAIFSACTANDICENNQPTGKSTTLTLS